MEYQQGTRNKAICTEVASKGRKGQRAMNPCASTPSAPDAASGASISRMHETPRWTMAVPNHRIQQLADTAW